MCVFTTDSFFVLHFRSFIDPDQHSFLQLNLLFSSSFRMVLINEPLILFNMCTRVTPCKGIPFHLQFHVKVINLTNGRKSSGSSSSKWNLSSLKQIIFVQTRTSCTILLKAFINLLPFIKQTLLSSVPSVAQTAGKKQQINEIKIKQSSVTARRRNFVFTLMII